jgi:5-dehydro-2-deoxygluconokinase
LTCPKYERKNVATPGSPGRRGSARDGTRRGDDADAHKTGRRHANRGYAAQQHEAFERAPVSAFEVLTMGRVGVDLYPLQTGVGLEDVETFGKWLGGSATNVAVAAARYQRKTAVITRTGDDPFGRFVHKALKGYGVDDRYVTSVPELPTPVTFCEIFPPDDFPIYFYRWPKAPDLEIRGEELDLDAIKSSGVFWVTVTGLCDEPSRSATLAALRARGRRGITVLDLDYRPQFWASRADARQWVQRALPHVSVAVGNLDECDTAVGTREPLAAAQALHDFGVGLAIVKQGPKGVLAHDRAMAVEVPPVPVDVVNGLGAGDAFGGALCHGLLVGWDVERVMRFANAAGAIVASRVACSDAMPTAAEVEALLNAEPQEGTDA